MTIKEYKGCKPTTIKVMGEVTLVDRYYNKFQDNRKPMEGELMQCLRALRVGHPVPHQLPRFVTTWV